MRELVRRHYFIIGLCLTFLVVICWVSLRWYSHQLNPDAMSYFSIAQKYAHGDFRHAINGYWSPLLSWLLVPAVWLHLNLIVAAKWLNALIAGVLLAIVYLYLVRRRVDRIVTYATCFVLATILAVWVVYEVVTPDLLEALLLVMFAFCLTSFTRCPRQRLAYAIGIVGAGLYYAKGMGFYLALLVILTSAGWEWWSSNARSVRPVLRHYLPILIIFFGLTLPFIAIISVKYHRPTISNAGTFDWNVYGVHGQGIQPIDSIGPVAPPNATAVSAWEDPTFLSSQTPNWNPLQSRAALSYFGKLVWQNFTAIFSIMQGFGSYLSFAFVLLLIACVRRSTYQRDAIVFTGVTLISIAAYILIFIDARYLWGEAVLAVTITALFLSKLLDEKSIGRLQVVAATAVIGGVMLLNTAQTLVGSRDIGQDEYDAGVTLTADLPAGSRVISDQFSETFPICYQLQLRCYGVLTPTAQSGTYDKLLQKFGIVYYLDFHTRDNDPALQGFVASHALFVQDWHTDDLHYTLYKLY